MKSAISQGKAVYVATVEVLGASGVEFDPSVPAAEQVDQTTRGQIVERVVDMFRSGEAVMKESESNRAKLSNTTELRKYVVGLIHNWYKKSRELNGGIAYVPARTGTRTSDPEMRELRKLLKSYEEGTAQRQAIADRIALRQAELDAAKPKATADLSKISPELRSLLGLE